MRRRLDHLERTLGGKLFDAHKSFDIFKLPVVDDHHDKCSLIAIFHQYD